MKQRITSDCITALKPGEIFVFGSNLEGAHGGGAALQAWRQWGAVWGQGAGLQGQTYGIPTMHGGPEAIRPYVDEFIRFAQMHPELTFLVTEIGCGICRIYPAGHCPFVPSGCRCIQHLLASALLGCAERKIKTYTATP